MTDDEHAQLASLAPVFLIFAVIMYVIYAVNIYYVVQRY
jgi:hypothetical protein